MTQDQAAKNEKSVTRALWTLRAYVYEVSQFHPNQRSKATEEELYVKIDHVSDLLTDLMHYCHGGEYSFADCLRNAQINFGEEVSHDRA